MSERSETRGRTVVAFPGQGDNPVLAHELVESVMETYDQFRKQIGEVTEPIFYGNSIGFYMTLVASGVLKLKEAVYLAQKREEIVTESEERAEEEAFLAKARGQDITLMGRTAMMSVKPEKRSMMEELMGKLGLSISNEYGSYAVVSGTMNALNAAVAEAGTSLGKVLNVKGGYHIDRRREDSEIFATHLSKVDLRDPNPDVVVVSSTKPRVIGSGFEAGKELVSMLYDSVDFPKAVSVMRSEGARMVVDLDPKRSFGFFVGQLAERIPTMSFQRERDKIKVALFGNSHLSPHSPS